MISDVRVTGNYSYTCERMGGPGWVMVGDAFAFVDPVFSSGVYLAMHSGKQAAALVDAVLREPAREAALQPAFSAAHPPRRARVLVVHLPLQFAGHARSLREPAQCLARRGRHDFDAWPATSSTARRCCAACILFKTIYAISGMLSLRRFIADLIERRRQARYAFSGGNTPVDPA